MINHITEVSRCIHADGVDGCRFSYLYSHAALLETVSYSNKMLEFTGKNITQVENDINKIYVQLNDASDRNKAPV